MTDTMFEVGQRILFFRERKGFTQENLAEKVGLTQPAICQIERGKRQQLNLKQLGDIAMALDVSVPDLLQIDPNEAQPVFFGLSTALRNTLNKLSQLTPQQQDKVGTIIQNILELP